MGDPATGMGEPASTASPMESIFNWFVFSIAGFCEGNTSSSVMKSIDVIFSKFNWNYK